jgi:hypothetical protein
MPIDRAARDRMSQAIAQYMRGEIAAFEFDDRLIDCARSADKAVEAIRLILWNFYDDITNHSVSLSEEGWNYFRRILAFLQTDLPLELSEEERKARPWQMGFIGLFFGIEAIAIAVSLREDSWATAITTYLLLGCILCGLYGRPLLNLLLAAIVVVVASPILQAAWVKYAQWFLFGVGALPILALWIGGGSEPPEPEEPSFDPFQDEAQWKRYEHYVERFELPPFVPGIQDKPIRSRTSSSLMGLISTFYLPLFWPLHMLLLGKLSGTPSSAAEEKH